MHERIPPQTGRLTTEELWADFEALRATNTQLPQNEYATWTIPRSSSEWRLANDDYDCSGEGPLMLPMRYDIEQFRDPDLARYVKYRTANPPANAYMTVMPQPSVMHEARASDYTGYAKSMLEHYAHENSLARKHGMPMLLMRFDSIDDKFGNGQIAELDDVNSLWSRLRIVNPIAASYLDAMESQLGMPIHSVELFDRPHSWQSDGVAFSVDVTQQPDEKIKLLTDWSYLHDDDWWRGNIHDINTQVDYMTEHCKELDTDEVALIVRARRQNPKFKEFMDTYGERSITMAWERDDKWPLVATGLGILAANVEVALKFAAEHVQRYPKENLVLKTRHGARTEGVAPTKAVGQREQGVFSPAQIRNKFGRAGAADEPVIIQRCKRPPTLAEDNFTFRDGDQAVIRSVRHRSHGRDYEPGKRAVPGQENRIKRINRHYVVYLPKEKRLLAIGGWWWASEGLIVHGSSNSFCGPLYIAGLQAHPNHRTQDTERAEQMLASYDHLRYIDTSGAFDLRQLQQTAI